MSLPRKGTRRITVDGIRYRWMAVYEPVDYCAATCPLRVIVQHQGGKGQVLIAQFQSLGTDELGQVWMFPRYGSVITPGIVADIIRAGLVAGWQPVKSGQPPLVIDGEPFLKLPVDPTSPPPDSDDARKRQLMAELRKHIQHTVSDSATIE